MKKRSLNPDYSPRNFVVSNAKHTAKFHCVGIATLGAQYFYITQIWAMLEFNYNNIKQPHKYLLYNIRE